MKVLLLVAALGGILVGCVTPGPQAKRPTAADDPSNGCFAEIAYDKRFVVLREKMAINVKADQPSLDMLANKTTPNDEERVALREWVSQRATCASMGTSFRAQHAPPVYAAQFNATQTAIANLAARLYGGDITYGEFNRARAENSSAGQARLAEEAQRARDLDNAQRAANQRAAAAMAQQNFQTQQILQQQQQIQNQQMLQQSMPTTTTTNCQRWGNQVNCTTR